MNISIRQIDESDWQLFRKIRLKALKSDPSVFGSNYEKESKNTEDNWKSRIRSKDRAVFLVFDDEKPIGMTGIFASDEEFGKNTAMLWGSWLEPKYRGKGLSNEMFKVRIDWAKQHPKITRIIVAHRESNHTAKHAIRKHNFIETHKHEYEWTDGEKENEVNYELNI